MFTGEYRHSVDDKGRLAVPAKFRSQLADGAVVCLDGPADPSVEDERPRFRPREQGAAGTCERGADDGCECD